MIAVAAGFAWLRRFRCLVFVLAVAIVAVSTFSISYRHWAYQGWTEYHLLCRYSDTGYREIPFPATTNLHDAIEAYYQRSASRWSGENYPIKRDGDHIYMRPWFYFGLFGRDGKDTKLITHYALGGKPEDIYKDLGQTYCSHLYNNPKLFLYEPNPYDPSSVLDVTGYIYSLDYLWFLSVIAPPPERH